MHIFLVGGTFNLDGGRASGYFGKLAAALTSALPEASIKVLNGGSYASLEQAVNAVSSVTHLLWFADVPNELPKLLPLLKQRYPSMVLVSSKNNRRGLYDRPALYERMRRSRSELLVEFGDGTSGVLVASVLTISGGVVLEQSPHISEVAQEVALQFRRLPSLVFPLDKSSRLSSDSNSFQALDLSIETEIPVQEHVGAFGVQRRHHQHEGVDLYGLPGDPVRAMETGVVVGCFPFTGAAANSPWWADTECLLVEGASGVLNYGEICVREGLRPGVQISAGDVLGHLVQVLRHDKGRPMTMLHLERYATGTTVPLQEWSLGTVQPSILCDPTVLLAQAAYRKSQGGRL